MNITALHSLKGGSGTTTTACNLAAALAAKKVPVLLIELCPSNLLRICLGQQWRDSNGLRNHLNKHFQTIDDHTENDWLKECIYHSKDGVSYIPYGRPDNGNSPKLQDLNRAFTLNPQWLVKSLSALKLAKETIILLDCPSGNSSLQKSIEKSVRKHIYITTADPLSYMKLKNNLDHFVQKKPIVSRKCLINKYNPMLPLENDIHTLMQHEHSNFFLPLSLHRDEAVREAVANKLSTIAFAPQSQAASDFMKLADYLYKNSTEDERHG